MALTRLNFLPQPRTDTFFSWLRLIPSLILVGSAAFLWQQQQDKLHIAQAKLQSLQTQPAPAPRVQRTKEEQRALEAQAIPLAQAVRQLNLPIPNMLQALQAPKDIRVALLAIDFGGRSSNANSSNAVNLKILAEAKTGADMVNYIAFLDDQSLFSSVYLQKHEIAADSKDGHYRFQLEVQWQP